MIMPIIGVQRSRIKKSNVKVEKGDISITKKRALRSKRYASLSESLSSYASSDLAFCMINHE
jgi:hypothetical protein